MGLVGVSGGDKKMSCIGIIMEVKSMEDMCSWFEFNEATRCMNLEHTPTIMAVISDVMLFAKEKKCRTLAIPSLLRYTSLEPNQRL
jgi:hypothetical protein